MPSAVLPAWSDISPGYRYRSPRRPGQAGPPPPSTHKADGLCQKAHPPCSGPEAPTAYSCKVHCCCTASADRQPRESSACSALPPAPASDSHASSPPGKICHSQNRPDHREPLFPSKEDNCRPPAPPPAYNRTAGNHSTPQPENNPQTAARKPLPQARRIPAPHTAAAVNK